MCCVDLSSVCTVPLRLASLADVVSAVSRSCDTQKRAAAMQSALVSRRSDALDGSLPDSIWLLRDASGCVGWVGWALYPEHKDAWQTTTYLPPCYRGTGLFLRSRCLQMHAAEKIALWSNANALAQPLFVSSIAVDNFRSLRASERYAATCRWPDTWRDVFEVKAQRNARVFSFPPLPVDHLCFLQTPASLVDCNGSRPI